jgi:hypothetical protein
VSAKPVNPFLDLLAEEDESRALVPTQTVELDHPITGGELEVLYRLGRGLARSGMFKDAKQADQAFAKLIFGRDLRLSATQAMTDIHIIEGKPEMSANLQAAKVRSSERYEYRVVDLTNERCEIAFTLDGEELVPNSVFTMEDAKTAGLTNKPPWKNYPRNMLFARAMSNGVAFHCPDVMNGIRVYAEGELSESRGVESSGTPAKATKESENVQDAEVVADPFLTDEERAALIASVEEAGVNLDMLLTATGFDSTDDLTQSGRLAISQKLADQLAGASA